MITFRFLLFLRILCNVCLATSIEQEIISYARDYRKNTELSFQEENLRVKNILKKAFDLIPKYDGEDSLEKAVTKFVFNTFTSLEYVIVDASSTDFGGKSDDPVFLIKDVSDHLCFVVKAFKSPQDLSSKFLPEISGLDLIEQLSITGTCAIKPIAFASYSHQVDEWGLLLETAAQGKRIDHLVSNLGNLTLNSKERKVFLEFCQVAFRRMGESFAKLHATKSSNPSSIQESELTKYDHRLSIIRASPQILAEMEKHFSLDDFFRYVETIKINALNTPIFYSYWHGDAHLGNMFYDDTQDIFYFIDVAKLHLSVGINEEPLIDGTIDLVHVEENLRRITVQHLSEHEVQGLMGSFYEGYEKHSSQSLPEHALLFNKTNKKLERLVTYARYLEEEDPKKRSLDQAIFDNIMSYFTQFNE